MCKLNVIFNSKQQLSSLERYTIPSIENNKITIIEKIDPKKLIEFSKNDKISQKYSKTTNKDFSIRRSHTTILASRTVTTDSVNLDPPKRPFKPNINTVSLSPDGVNLKSKLKFQRHPKF